MAWRVSCAALWAMGDCASPTVQVRVSPTKITANPAAMRWVAESETVVDFETVVVMDTLRATKWFGTPKGSGDTRQVS
jgi:hypothetical protein